MIIVDTEIAKRIAEDRPIHGRHGWCWFQRQAYCISNHKLFSWHAFGRDPQPHPKCGGGGVE